jgi:hypothetical protein
VSPRVIRNSFRETIKRNPADLVSTLVTGVAALASLLILADVGFTPNSLLQGTMQRFSTAMISAFFIATVNFVQHWAGLKREGRPLTHLGSVVRVSGSVADSA